MKILDRILILVFNLCLLLVSIWFILIPLIKSVDAYRFSFKLLDFYSSEYKENETLNSSKVIYDGKVYHKFNYVNGSSYDIEDYDKDEIVKENVDLILKDSEIDIVINHIVDYLFGNLDSFEFILEGNEEEGVLLYYPKTKEFIEVDKVSLFGEKAINHMIDVKETFINFQIICVVAFVFGLGILAYLLLRIGQLRHIIFEYTMFFYAGLFTLLSILCMIILVNVIVKTQGQAPNMNDIMVICWENLHYLFFPFQPDKFDGSYLADLLPEILDVKLFIGFTCVVLMLTLIVELIWLVITLIIKIFGGQIGYKIKQKKYSSINFT